MDSKRFKSSLNSLSDIYGDVVQKLIAGYEILEAASGEAEYVNEDEIERDFMAAMTKLASDVDKKIAEEDDPKQHY